LSAFLSLGVARRKAQQLSHTLQLGARLSHTTLVHSAGLLACTEGFDFALVAHRAAGSYAGCFGFTHGCLAAQLQRAHGCVPSPARGESVALHCAGSCYAGVKPLRSSCRRLGLASCELRSLSSVLRVLQAAHPATPMQHVCIGDEWHRFPSSFFLPGPAYRLQFVKSGFDGLLPRPFSQTDVSTNTPCTRFALIAYKCMKFVPRLRLLTGCNGLQGGTRAAPRQLNDRNAEETGNYWVSSERCDFFVGLTPPSDSGAVSCSFLISSHSWIDPARPHRLAILQMRSDVQHTRITGWTALKSEPFLDKDASSRLGRAFLLPWQARRPIVMQQYSLWQRTVEPQL
jgi:hypothetical protein